MKTSGGSSNSSDSSTSNNNNATNDDGTYTILYDGITLASELPKTYYDAYAVNFTDSMYTKNGTTVTLNNSGFDKWLSLSNSIAIVEYNNKLIMAIDEEEFDYYASFLTEGIHYNLSHNNKVVSLTKAGWDYMDD